MNFNELLYVFEQSTPDPTGLRRSTIGTKTFNPQILTPGKPHPTGKSSKGNTFTTKSLRNIFRLLRNDPNLSQSIDEILQKFNKRKTINDEQASVLEKNISNIQTWKKDLYSYEKAVSDSERGKAVLSDAGAILKRIDKLNGEIKTAEEENKEILDKVEFFREENELLEHNLRKRLIRSVSESADTLLKNLQQAEKPKEVKTLTDLGLMVSTDEDLEQDETKIQVLQSLMETTPEKNVFIRFLDSALNKYNEHTSRKGVVSGRFVWDQVSSFNMLPLSQFSRFYNSSVINSGVIRLKPVATALSGGFKGSQAGSKKMDPNLAAAKKLAERNFGTDDEGVTKRVKDLVRKSIVGPKTKSKLDPIIDSIISGDENAPKRLADILYGKEGNIMESTYFFNGLVNKMLKQL